MNDYTGLVRHLRGYLPSPAEAEATADAIETLQAEVEIYAHLHRLLIAERDALRADAKRYRWLRKMHNETYNVTMWHVRGVVGQPIAVGELDAEIDAAIAAEGGKT